jgi:hypothetical protein
MVLIDDTNETDGLDPTNQLGWFQDIKGYLPHQWSITQATLFRDQGHAARFVIGTRWTTKFITVFWT